MQYNIEGLCDAAGDGRLEDVKKYVQNGVDINRTHRVSNYINLYISHVYCNYVLDVYSCILYMRSGLQKSTIWVQKITDF